MKNARPSSRCALALVVALLCVSTPAALERKDITFQRVWDVSLR